MKHKILYRGLAAALCLLLLLCLCGCGEAEPEIGRYLCLELRNRGVPMETPESTLMLDRGGYARLELEGEGGAVHWSRTNGGLNLTVDGRTVPGIWEDGVLRLETDEGTSLLYVREDLAEDYRARLEQERAELAAWQAPWSGDWSGWWRVDNSEGELGNTWYDLCARLTPKPDGSVYLLLWDEDQSTSEPMAEVILRPNGETAAVAEDGYFWLEPLAGAEWSLQLADGRLTRAGRHEAGDEHFDYSLCLRPWGERWDDPNERPYYYESWYLPLIEAGKSLPDRMQVDKLN